MRKTVSARLYEVQQLDGIKDAKISALEQIIELDKKQLNRIRNIVDDCELSYREKIRALEWVLGM